MNQIQIRPYRESDREAVRKIFCDTAFMGSPMEVFIDDRQLMGDFLTLYYTDYEPESLFVAESQGQIIGCLAGCVDSALKEKTWQQKIFLQLILSVIRKGLIFRNKSLKLAFYSAQSFFRGEFNWPAIPREYPAHLHINIAEGFRRESAGSKLMAAFLEYLKKRNVRGLHVATFSEQGSRFFLKMGFTPLWEKKSSLWRYILHRDVTTCVFVLRVE